MFTAACLYEVLSISFLDRIGYEENKLNGSGMIMRTYGLMGLGAAVSFWTMNLIENHFANAMIVLGLSFFFATTMIIKRPQDSSLLSQPSNNINNQI